MVKLWGYNYSTGMTCPSGMFVTQRLRAASDGEGGVEKAKKVIMKLPKVYDVQRLTLARHLMYLSHPEVRQGKEASPKEFEINRVRFRQLGIDLRAAGTRGGRRNAIRKKREVVGESIPEVVFEEGRPQEHKWDIKQMSFKNIKPELIKERQSKNRKRTAEEAEENERKSREEEWQRRHWLAKFIRDRKSDRINEILANYRMVTCNSKAVGFQPEYTIFLESAIHALKTHNWPVISQSLCGMVEKYRQTKYMRDNSQVPSALNALWMLGFLTVTNHYKDDVQKVEQFARNVHTLLGGHPLWIASHQVVWLIQKGYFMAAHRIANEYSSDLIHRSSWFRTPTYNKLENPKRDMAVFLTEMVKAVYLYCIWRKESSMLEAHENDGSDDDTDDLTGAFAIRRDTLRRDGEAALLAFEICYSKYKAIEGDAMCFIQPFIELVVEFRSVQRAREILEEVFNINDGNLFVEEFYADFLEEHYVHSEEDLITFIRKRTHRKFNYAEDEEDNRRGIMRKGKRQIRQLKETRKKSGGKSVPSFRKISKPAFSW